MTGAVRAMIADTVQDISVPGFTLNFQFEDLYGYLQVGRWVYDVDDPKKEPELHRGRKWLLSYHMTPGEVVQTVLKACLTFDEHEIREGFRYKGERIFGPHLDVDKLVEFVKDTTELLRSEES